MAYKPLITLLIGGLFSTSAALAQRSVSDPSKEGGLIQNYILQSMKTAQEEAQQSQEQQKKDAQNDITKLLGKPVAANLSTDAIPATPEDADYLKARTAALENVDPNSPLGQYVAWTNHRRAADAAMSLQLQSVLKAADGKEMDWTGHQQLAIQLRTLSNDRLALSIAEANAMMEARIRQKAYELEVFQAENDQEKREDAERRLRRP